METTTLGLVKYQITCLSRHEGEVGRQEDDLYWPSWSRDSCIGLGTPTTSDDAGFNPIINPHKHRVLLELQTSYVFVASLISWALPSHLKRVLRRDILARRLRSCFLAANSGSSVFSWCRTNSSPRHYNDLTVCWINELHCHLGWRILRAGRRVARHRQGLRIFM